MEDVLWCLKHACWHWWLYMIPFAHALISTRSWSSLMNRRLMTRSTGRRLMFVCLYINLVLCEGSLVHRFPIWSEGSLSESLFSQSGYLYASLKDICSVSPRILPGSWTFMLISPVTNSSTLGKLLPRWTQLHRTIETLPLVPSGSQLEKACTPTSPVHQTLKNSFTLVSPEVFGLNVGLLVVHCS